MVALPVFYSLVHYKSTPIKRDYTGRTSGVSSLFEPHVVGTHVYRRFGTTRVRTHDTRIGANVTPKCSNIVCILHISGVVSGGFLPRSSRTCVQTRLKWFPYESSRPDD